MRKRRFVFECLSPRVLACDGCGADCAEIGPADPAMVNPMGDPAPAPDPAIEGASMSPPDDPYGPDPVPIVPDPGDFYDEHDPDGAPKFIPLPPLPVGPAGPAF